MTDVTFAYPAQFTPDADGRRHEVVSRIYPPAPLDEWTVGCVLSLDENRDKRERMFGLTYTAAREYCFSCIEHRYRVEGVRRITVD